MQTEAPTLPVVQLDVHKTFNRKSKPNSKSLILEPKKLSPCRSTLLPSNKKCLNPLLGGPYRSTIKQSLSDEPKPSNKSILGQRVMSAKMLRFKQLQNQLADAHYHLNELANENRLLKALQKRQDSALRRYEGTNAELPRIINSHHEELRVLQAKYKKLKELHKDTCNLLKEKENELHSVNSQNKHLLQLSKNRNLGEREKLQLEISDMDHKIQQQQETIQLLHRKLALETKSMKHQLHVEISKHKETQKNLQKTIEKLKTLESLLDNREKRLYYNGQLPIYIKEKNLGSHSFTNLRDISTPTSVKTFTRNRKNGNLKDNLPSLDTLESNDDEIAIRANNVNHGNSIDQLKSETMSSLQQIRKFRLQRSHMRKNAHSMDDLRIRFKDTEVKHVNEKDILYQNTSVDFKAALQRNSPNNDESGSGKLRKLFSRMKEENSQKLQKGVNLPIESDYTSDDGESENASEHRIECYPTDTAQKSRELYARLISSTDDTSDTLDDMIKRVNIESNEEKEELGICPARNLTFQKHKYKSKPKILHHRNKDLYDSDSEADSEKGINTNRGYSFTEYKTNNFPTDLSKYEKKQFNKSFNDNVYPGYKTPENNERSVIGELKNGELQRISGNTSDNIHIDKIEESQQSTDTNNLSLEEQHFLENTMVNNTFTDIKKEGHMKEEKTEYLENKSVYSDILHDKIYHDTFKQNNACNEMKSSPSLKRTENQYNSQLIHEKHDVISKIGLLHSKEAEYTTIERSKVALNKDKYMVSHSDGSNNSMQNLINECHMPKAEEISSRVCHSDKSITLDENDSNIETKNILNASLEAKPVNTSYNNEHVPHQTEVANGTKTETTDTKQINDKKRVINYNKEKLLATMKAIDNNENIEFLNHSFKNHNVVNRMQITENLFRGLPTHSKSKRDIIKDIFEDDHIENKSRGTCSKSH